jgi:glycosyltransferase involved in cell wall biosynthesis
MLGYGSRFHEVYVIVFTLRAHNIEDPVQIRGNVWAYPTRSTSRWRYPLDAYLEFKRILRNDGESRCDIVSTQDPFETGLVGYLLRLRFGLPLHVQIHTDIYSEHFRTHSWLNRLRRFIGWFVLYRARCVRVVSQRIREKLVKHHGHLRESVQVLPVFAGARDMMRMTPAFDLHEQFPQFAYIALVVSRLTTEKDLYTALDALAVVREGGTDVGLVIAGEGPELDALKEHARQLQIIPAVQFIGWQDDLVSLFKTADVYLLTSHFEGYGRTLMHAAAAGTPIVSTDVGIAGSQLIHDEHALIAQPGDTETIAQHLETLLTDTERARTIAENAQAVAQEEGEFDEYLDAVRDGIVECYRSHSTR